MDNTNLPTREQLRAQRKKNKKHFYKSWWFWSIIVILLLAGGGVAGMKMTSTGPFASSSKVSKTKKKTTKKKTVKTKKGITVSQYEGIYIGASDGLTQSDLEKNLGKASSTTNNDETSVATWNNIENGGLGATLTVNFTNGHATSKSLTNLKVKRTNKLRLNDYNMIQNNESQNDVIADLGRPNGYNETVLSGTTTQYLTYSSDVAGETGANFIIAITNGVVSGKSQTGLN